MSEPGKTEGGSDTESAKETPDAILHSRYIRDLSFENPGAPTVPDLEELRFDVSVLVDARYLDNFHEVALTVRVTAVHNEQVTFLMELVYAGLFELDEDSGWDENIRQRFLLREAPRLLFPWVDRIFADLARDGGLPQLSLSPPDFAALYEQQKTAEDTENRNQEQVETV